MKYVSTINLKELILFHKNTNDSLFLLTLLCTCLCHMLSLSIMIRTLDYCDDDVLWIWYQCVMKPKIWAKPNPILFSIPIFFKTDFDTFIDTKNFRNRYQYFFRYQKFLKPIPSKNIDKFWNWLWSFLDQNLWTDNVIVIMTRLIAFQPCSTLGVQTR